MGDGDHLVDAEGRVFRKGASGVYVPKQGVFGQERDAGILGPNVKRGILGPVEARDAWGGRRKAEDGTPLFERASRGSSGDEGLAILLTVIVLVVIAIMAAIVLAFVVACIAAAVWWLRGFARSIRGDRAHDRIASAATIAWALSGVAMAVALVYGQMRYDLLAPARGFVAWIQEVGGNGQQQMPPPPNRASLQDSLEQALLHDESEPRKLTAVNDMWLFDNSYNRQMWVCASFDYANLDRSASGSEVSLFVLGVGRDGQWSPGLWSWDAGTMAECEQQVAHEWAGHQIDIPGT